MGDRENSQAFQASMAYRIENAKISIEGHYQKSFVRLVGNAGRQADEVKPPRHRLLNSLLFLSN